LANKDLNLQIGSFAGVPLKGIQEIYLNMPPLLLTEIESIKNFFAHISVNKTNHR